MKKRTFLKTLTMGGLGMAAAPPSLLQPGETAQQENLVEEPPRPYNTPYTNDHLARIAFPIGGLGAGMFCLEGTGAISHMSVRNSPDVFHSPLAFGACAVRNL